MAVPSTPTNFYLQQGNGKVLASCDLTATALTYPVWRSVDGVTFSNVASPSTPNYLDSSVVAGTLYYYYMTASNGSGPSVATATQSIIPVLAGDMSLAQVRLMAQQRADMVNSNFLTVPEWNTNIVNSYFELYDLLVTVYEDYFVKTPLIIPTDGVTSQFTLPTDFYKLTGVDLAINASVAAYVTLNKFDFVQRNSYLYPQLNTTALGIANLKYRLVGNTLMMIPTPAGGQNLRVWYIPRLVQPLQETDILDGVSGWLEYVIVDAAIKALQKEESDVSVLAMEKMALVKRIEESAMNRDAGMPDTISDVRRNSMGWYGMGNEPLAGY